MTRRRKIVVGGLASCAGLLVLFVGLVSWVDYRYRGTKDPAHAKMTAGAIEVYWEDQGALPDESEYPDRLVELEYFESVHIDSFGREMQYVRESDTAFMIIALGRDGVRGGTGPNADVVIRRSLRAD